MATQDGATSAEEFAMLMVDAVLAEEPTPVVRIGRHGRLLPLAKRRTKNLRARQVLPGHAKLESTIRHLGIEVGDAVEMVKF